MHNLLGEITNNVISEYAKAKDKWILETLEKHGLIKSDDISNFDAYWLQSEMGVRFVLESDQTKIFMNDHTLIGVWYDSYSIENKDGKITIKTNYWN